MRCPRCHAPVPVAVPPTGKAGPGASEARAPAFCRECGAPLRLADEPRPPPLDASLVLDRRTPGRPAAETTFAGLGSPEAARDAPPAPAVTGGLAAVERSHWDLHVPAGAEGPGPSPAAAPARAVGEQTPGQGLPDAEVDALEIHLRRPPSWRRAAADALDFGPFVAGGILLGRWLIRTAAGLPAPATGLDGFLDLLARERVIVLSLAAAVTLAMGTYATLAHALAGATLGKRLLGLAVVGPDGARPSLGRSTARSALAVLSAALLGLGLLLPYFTRSGRALHDLLARTWVVEAP